MSVFHYKEKDTNYFFDIYNCEFLDSNKKQFIYMKNVVKVIYYMVYHEQISLNDAIILIRLNALNGKFFIWNMLIRIN